MSHPLPRNLDALPAFESFQATFDGPVVSAEQIIADDPTIQFELAMEIASARNRMSQDAPSTFRVAPVGTIARDKNGELWVLADVPLDSVVQVEGTSKTNDTAQKYAGWLSAGHDPLPAHGVQNIAVHGGRIKLNDGHHRYSGARLVGRSSYPTWVNLTDPENDARPLLELGSKLETSLALLEKHGARVRPATPSPEIVDSIPDISRPPGPTLRHSTYSIGNR